MTLGDFRRREFLGAGLAALVPATHGFVLPKDSPTALAQPIAYVLTQPNGPSAMRSAIVGLGREGREAVFNLRIDGWKGRDAPFPVSHRYKNVSKAWLSRRLVSIARPPDLLVYVAGQDIPPDLVPELALAFDHSPALTVYVSTEAAANALEKSKWNSLARSNAAVIHTSTADLSWALRGIIEPFLGYGLVSPDLADLASVLSGKRLTASIGRGPSDHDHADFIHVVLPEQDYPGGSMALFAFDEIMSSHTRLHSSTWGSLVLSPVVLRPQIVRYS